MLIDTHCHLASKRFKNDLEKVLRRAREAGVKKMILPATNLEEAKEIGRLCREKRGLWGLAGFYPGEIKRKERVQREKERLQKFIKKNRDWVVGIGEIGLDKYWLTKQPEVEKAGFRAQLELASELSLPVVIHNRDAEKEIREVMEGMAKLPSGEFHCWTGTDGFLSYILEKGFAVGLGGNLTYPANEEIREQAKRIPRERLLLETDSPYLPPQGKRGERNEPRNVRITASRIAKVRGVSLIELTKTTKDNAERLFGI